MKDMDMELIYGSLEPFTRDNGALTKHMARVYFGIKVAIFILGNSSKIKHMVMESIFIRMAHITKVNGVSTHKKDKVKKCG